MNDRRETYDERKQRQEHQALTVVDPLRMPLPALAVQQHQLNESKWRALTESVFPSAKSVTGILMALDYCAARNLDVFKRPVHVVPMWNSKLNREVETVWPGIGELRTTASRTGQWAGSEPCQFGRIITREFHEKRTSPGRGNSQPRVTEASCPAMDFPEWAQFTVYKMVGGVRCQFVGPQVFFLETFSGEKGLRVPNARWRQAPRQMLQKCAEAAALRMAFPEELGESYAAEEMDGKVVNSTVAQAEFADADRTDDRGEGEQLQRQDTRSDEPGAGHDDDHDDDRDDRSNQAPDSVWTERTLLDFMGGMRRALNNVKSIELLERMLVAEKDRVDSLPDAERREAQQLEHDARSRIETAAREANAEQGGAAAADTSSPQAETAQSQDNAEDPYVVEFRAKVARIEMIVDLNRFEGETMDELDEKPVFIANLCRRILQNRRDALKPSPK